MKGKQLTDTEGTILSGFFMHFCTVTAILIVFLLYDTVMVVTGVTET